MPRATHLRRVLGLLDVVVGRETRREDEGRDEEVKGWDDG